MPSTLVLLSLVVAAWLAAHVAFEWLGRRFMVLSGAEYLLLGILVGPQVSGLLTAETTGAFAPFLTLALGWIGALVGAQFHLPSLLQVPAIAVRLAFTESGLALALVATAMAGILAGVLGVPLASVALPALALGAVALPSAPAAAALASLGNRRSATLLQVQVTTAVEALVGIVILGILLSALHPGGTRTSRPPTPTEWAVISLAIGCLGGVLFHLFLGSERHIDRLFVGLAGAVILVSGGAAYLHLSPLLPAMLVGAILVNTSGNRDEVRQVLSSVERPLYFVLLIFAGALWSPPTQAWVLPVLLFVGVRLSAKLGAAWLAARSIGPHRPSPAWGLALLGHGGLGAALALSYGLARHAPLADLVFTAGIASILITDGFSARLAHRAVGRRDVASPPQPSATAEGPERAPAIRQRSEER